MAACLYQFDVDDDSPEIAYFPFVNLEPSTNLSAGWQLLYTGSGAATGPGQVGVGTRSHYTSLDGASLSINWNGTGIDLIGSVSNAHYNVSLDGLSSTYLADPANTILASFNDLENTNHSLLLTTIITNKTSDAFLAFDKACITYAPPPGLVNATATSQPVTDSDIAFMGKWNYMVGSTGNAMHTSGSAGDRAETTFQGSAITIYGLTSSYSGKFTVTLDDITTNLSALSSYNNSDSLLFYATNLPQDILHHIAVINQENRTFALQVGGVNFTSFGNTTTTSTSSSSGNSIPAGTIAAAILAAILFLVIVGIFYYACCIRRKARRTINQRTMRRRSNYKGRTDIEQFANISLPSGEELESTSLSTSKGYGFGLGLRRGFPFTYRKSKLGSNSSGRSRNAIDAQAESHPMTSQFNRDEKRLSINTLSDTLPVLAHAPESEKLAPGWSNPVARTAFRYGRWYNETSAVVSVDDDNDDDADVKTLTSRQDETLAATLSLSPRTAGTLTAIDGAKLSKLDIDAQDDTRQLHDNQRPAFLQVQDTGAFKADVSAIFGTRKNRDSKRTSGSSNSAWSKVYARLYWGAHQDDGRRSDHTSRRDTSGSSGPESVPVVMHESGSANPPSETAPGSGSYSFLDLASSHPSSRQYSKATTLSSAPVELGHGVKETSAWSENTSVRMVRTERSRNDMLSLKPDAPSTASGGSHPSDDSGSHTVPSVPTTYTQASAAFPFLITIPPSAHTVHPPNQVPERHITPPPPLPPHTPPSQPDQDVRVPQIISPELTLTPAGSPTESVPFSVSDIYFRHSYSDYTSLDSQRASVSSGLPPHPPLPHLEGQANIPVYSPPYIVQRVLGLPMSPLNTVSPLTPPRIPSDRPANTTLRIEQLETAPTQLIRPFRVGSLLGPRPRPSAAGSVRGSAAPQLPMQGGRSNIRSRR